MTNKIVYLLCLANIKQSKIQKSCFATFLKMRRSSCVLLAHLLYTHSAHILPEISRKLKSVVILLILARYIHRGECQLLLFIHLDYV